ncbi:hypothetical protein [Rhodopseudomonas sp. B29]|uniref:hypothetical protein n=1 Tax=Rhodopseudomonas sp. B29 TaxID=95607 RepID=UPI0011D2993F|nr:hypothetical protein [Rhodopseudomonas sp. B29]
MLRVHLDPVRGSEALRSGAMQKAIGAFSRKYDPEASYFTVDGGGRTAFFVLDMQASHQMPAIAEIFFHIGAEVTLMPCMTPEDLQAGIAAIDL